VTIVAILIAIVGGTTIVLLRPEMKGSDWAAGVQAVGSIAAICAGFGMFMFRGDGRMRRRDVTGMSVRRL
jgi:hypothetical protein